MLNAYELLLNALTVSGCTTARGTVVDVVEVVVVGGVTVVVVVVVGGGGAMYTTGASVVGEVDVDVVVGATVVVVVVVVVVGQEKLPAPSWIMPIEGTPLLATHLKHPQPPSGS